MKASSRRTEAALLTVFVPAAAGQRRRHPPMDGLRTRRRTSLTVWPLLRSYHRRFSFSVSAEADNQEVGQIFGFGPPFAFRATDGRGWLHPRP
jgi:hypothetical protein